MINKKMKEYQQNQIKTASPEQILLMLYDGAIRFTRQAKEGVQKNDQNMRRYGVSKAMAIITEFSNSLDREIGGKIAEDLDALYDFMIREMSAANLNNDLEKLNTVEKLLVDLRQTWGEAVEINKKEQAEKSPEQQNKAPAQSGSFSSAYSSGGTKPENYTPLSISS